LSVILLLRRNRMAPLVFPTRPSLQPRFTHLGFSKLRLWRVLLVLVIVMVGGLAAFGGSPNSSTASGLISMQFPSEISTKVASPTVTNTALPTDSVTFTPTFKATQPPTSAVTETLTHSRTLNTDSDPYPVRWASAAGEIISPVVIAPNGTIYFGSTHRKVYALNSDGTLQWTYVAESEIQAAPILGPDGTLYVAAWSGILHALDAGGALKWSYQTKSGPLYSSPVIAPDGTLYLSAYPGTVHALKPDGSLKWKYYLGGATQSAPTLGRDGTVYVVDTHSTLYALRADGTLQWKYVLSADTVNHSPRVGPDGTIYIGGEPERGIGTTLLLAINPDGALKWKHDFGVQPIAPEALDANGVIYISAVNTVFALDSKNDLLWSYRPEKSPSLSLNVTLGPEGAVYASSPDGQLYALDQDGTLKWSKQVATTSDFLSWRPAFGPDDRLYWVAGNMLYADSLAALSGATPESTKTNIPTETQTLTPSPISTPTESQTPTPELSATPTAAETPTPELSATPMEVDTPIPLTLEPSPTLAGTETPTP
jgi:outer membrane protein assembly factor BamB